LEAGGVGGSIGGVQAKSLVCVCLSVCPLKTRERVWQLSPNFQGSSKVLRKWFEAQGIWGRW